MDIFRQRLLGIIAIIVAVGGFLLYPFETTVVPEWRLRVIDEGGHPCGGMHVNQGWKNYSVDLAAGNDGQRKATNSDGYVTFARRTIRAGIAVRIVNSAIAHVLLIAHGSVGIHAYVFASGMKNGPFLNYTPGAALPDTILVDRCSS